MIKISPSSLTYDLNGCPACMWRSIRYGKLSTPFPKVFTMIHDRLNEFALDCDISDFIPTNKKGKFGLSEAYVESQPIVGCFLKGRVDRMIEFEDGTIGLIDFKTTDKMNAGLLGVQLIAYAYCLEHSKSGRNQEVDSLYLVELKPIEAKWHIDGDEFEDKSTISLKLEKKAFEVNKDYSILENAINRYVAIAMMNEPPLSASNCETCKWVAKVRQGTQQNLL